MNALMSELSTIQETANASHMKEVVVFKRNTTNGSQSFKALVVLRSDNKVSQTADIASHTTTDGKRPKRRTKWSTTPRSSSSEADPIDDDVNKDSDWSAEKNVNNNNDQKNGPKRRRIAQRKRTKECLSSDDSGSDLPVERIGRHSCPVEGCAKILTTPLRLKWHVRNHVRGKTYKCEYEGCDRAFRDSSGLRSHKKCRHESPKMRWHSNQQYFDANTQTYICPHAECGLTFAVRTKLGLHLMARHSGRVFACDHVGCDRVFKSSDGLNDHKLIHCPKRCDRDGCTEVFSSAWALQKHRRAQHSATGAEPVIPCEWPGCDYRGTKYNVRRHRSLHTADRPYACEWPHCDSRFRFSYSLADHMNVHTNARPHACHWPGCTLRFNRTSNLQRHIKRIHERK
ncbi:unnamed protein product [Medioppia subpectinata]|uniref:C2H2-type domain-containing protein n=1 Tax=Medioppia subpectinata TaxID=1979941 RepID=A0A7R9LC92_9ACAR|nr:unnamed protein product [Medioppia subpectinata]CAG2117645.1 unnamed protein product [Medioppia subpectinata]